ncbi:MAG: hypothetical protein HN952_06135, partial [Candidatus Cloacimonetes bacterium]|nr:hypothetical protein [Candidatus Cloacimonadota bacterium]
MKKLFISFAILAMVAGLFATTGHEVKFSQTKDAEFGLNFELGDYEITEVVKNGVTYSAIKHSSNVTTVKKGFAELPYVNSAVQIANKNVNLEVNGDFEEITLQYPLLPSRGILYRNQDPTTIPYEINENSVVNSFYPENVATISEPYIMRDVRGTNVTFYPFQYNAETLTLRIYSNVNITLSENNDAVINPLNRADAKLTRVMDNLYKTAFINYTTDRFPNEIDEFGSILVLRPANYATAIAPYVAWKREKGYTVYEVEASGNVENTISSQYASHNDILYVQLVGDWADISGPTSGGAPVDPNMGCVEGGDIYPDLIVGRFSASSPTDITTQVNKTITYEKTPDNDNWYSKGLGIGSEQGAGNGDDGEADYAHMDIIKDNRLLPYTYTEVAEAYEYPSISDVSTPVNTGLSVINYCGHGSHDSWSTSGFSNSNVNSLSNGNKLPFIISIACVNGEFHTGGDCFAEAWLKKSNGGAVGMYAATINQSWAPPMKGQDYMMDLLIGGYDYSSNPGEGTTVDVQKTSYGAICFNGSILMALEDTSGGPAMLETWHIFGDASLQVRTDTPAEISLSNDQVWLGLAFNTTITSNGSPVEGALVAISQNDVVFSGVTNSNGEVNIAHDLLAGNAKLVVTAYNTETIYEDIVVMLPSDGPFITLVGTDFTGETAAGETIGMTLSLNNIGNESATNVNVTASATDGYLVFTDDSANYGTIAIDATEVVPNGFAFVISENVEDGYVSTIHVVITAGTETWEYDTSVTLYAPVLEIGNVLVDDDNNQLDAGDTAELLVNIHNNSEGASAYDLVATLSINSEFITINSANDNIGSISPNGMETLSFTVSVSEDAPIGTVANFSVLIPDYLNETFSLTVGLCLEDFESGSFTTYDWVTNWEISSESQEGVYAAVSSNHVDSSTSEMSTTLSVLASDE